MRFLKRKAGTNVARIDPQQIEQQVQDPTGLVRIFYELAANPDMPVEKMEQAVKLHERMFKQQAALEFNRAMNRVQKRIEPVRKNAWNEQTKSFYAKIESVANAVHQIAMEEGFSYSFSEGETPHKDHVRCVMIVRHVDGHSEQHYRDFAVDDEGIHGKKNKTETHGEASAFTYGRRYLTCEVFAVTLVPKDDDGNGAGGKVRRKNTISEQQVETLQGLINETGTDINSFLTYHKIEKLGDLPVKAFDESVDMLKTRKRAQESRRQAS